MPQSSASDLDSPVAQRWAQRIARFNQSKLSIAAFCAVEGVAKSGFFRWRRRLASPRRVPPTPGQPTLVPLRVTQPLVPAAPIELALPCGTMLRFPLDIQPQFLLAILRGLEERSC